MISLLDPVAHGSHTVVEVSGEVDASSAASLRDSMLALVNRGVDSLVIDLRGVTFIDSAGVRLVLEAMRALPAFAVVPGGHEVSRVFRLVGLDERIRTVDRPPDE